jgi:hypothetical protein
MRAYYRLNAGRFAIADLRAIDPLGAVGGLGLPSTTGHLDSPA